MSKERAPPIILRIGLEQVNQVPLGVCITPDVSPGRREVVVTEEPLHTAQAAADLSQQSFADTYEIPIGTIRHWEGADPSLMPSRSLF